VLYDVTSTVFDPGPLPVVKDGGPPNSNNEICISGIQINSWNHFYSGGNYYIYYYWAPWQLPPIDFTWGGDPCEYWVIGDCGWMFPRYTVTNYAHRKCEPAVGDRFIPFGDYTATASGGGTWDPGITDGGGEIYYEVKDSGSSSERWIFQYCDVNQMEEGDTCNYRVIINGSNNTNPSDMRIEWLDVGSHLLEDDEEHTGAYMVWNGVYIPIQCDLTAWQNDMSVDIDQP
jgi:hypothetical protein